jgi:2,3-bisphosphoglycerate-independent phosphoglycerate mutase
MTMKYIVLLGDGMADRPLKELGGRTPLQAAVTPNMDKLAREGLRGMVNTIPEGFPPGSDVANMNILGYDPEKYYSGRAPLEAASMGVELTPEDVAFRCNLVTLGFNKEHTKAYMEDYSAGHITTEEARELIEVMEMNIKEKDLTFYPGISYRHLLVWKNGQEKAECTPPHDILDKEITDYLPIGAGSEFLNDLMRKSVAMLQRHGINRKRMDKGKNPANSIWLWGQGRKPAFEPFLDKFGLTGSMVSAVDLTKGLAICAGLDVLDVPNVTGYLDTNYIGKAEYALRSLKEKDFVYIHVEAPDEAGHMGNVKDKVRAIEDFDELVVGTVLSGIKDFEQCRILLLPDHATPLELRTHTDDPVPFVLFDKSSVKDNGEIACYDESIRDGLEIFKVSSGHKLMDYFIRSEF